MILRCSVYVVHICFAYAAPQTKQDPEVEGWMGLTVYSIYYILLPDLYMFCPCGSKQ